MGPFVGSQWVVLGTSLEPLTIGFIGFRSIGGPNTKFSGPLCWCFGAQNSLGLGGVGGPSAMVYITSMEVDAINI